MMISDDHKFFLTLVIFLLVGKEIRRVRLFLHQIAAVLFVAQHPTDHRIAPIFHITHRWDPLFPQLTGDHMNPLPLIDIFTENKANDLRPFLIDIHLTAADVVTDHITAENNALFHAALLTPFYPLRGLAALFLGNG